MSRELPQVMDFVDIRCRGCRGLIMRADKRTIGDVEVFCRKCRRPQIIHLQPRAETNTIPTSKPF